MTPVYDIQVPVDLLHDGKSQDAIPILEFITDAMPAHVTAHVLLAQAYAKEERWEEAKFSWQNAAFLMPNSPAIQKGFRHVLKMLTRQISLSEAPVAKPEPPAPLPEVKEQKSTEINPSQVPKNSYAPPLPPVLAKIAQQAEIKDAEELDSLIEELESARIVPKPEHEKIETQVLETDIDDMVSETLARIFEGQKQFDEAARVYDKLATMQPDRASDFSRKASDLRARAANESD